jgi:hypothetical protein
MQVCYFARMWEEKVKEQKILYPSKVGKWHCSKTVFTEIYIVGLNGLLSEHVILDHRMLFQTAYPFILELGSQRSEYGPSLVLKCASQNTTRRMVVSGCGLV